MHSARRRSWRSPTTGRRGATRVFSFHSEWRDSPPVLICAGALVCWIDIAHKPLRSALSKVVGMNPIKVSASKSEIKNNGLLKYQARGVAVPGMPSARPLAETEPCVLPCFPLPPCHRRARSAPACIAAARTHGIRRAAWLRFRTVLAFAAQGEKHPSQPLFLTTHISLLSFLQCRTVPLPPTARRRPTALRRTGPRRRARPCPARRRARRQLGRLCQVRTHRGRNAPSAD